MSRSLRFILIFGIVSLFGDITYEGARSLIGPFLSTLGASGFIVGFVTGLGGFVGYGFRLFSGWLSDKTKQYWLITGIGYVINLIAVPLLGLAGNWEMAAILIVTERLGKGIRKPPRDAMLSYAAKETGSGWGFGIHEAMDQIGAILGPLIVMVVQAWKGSYALSFGLLAIPACCALAVLAVARFLYPHPETLEAKHLEFKQGKFPRVYWTYIAAVSLIAFGFVDFPLIAYHLHQTSAIQTEYIPLFYAVAMAVEGIGALVFGKLFDKIGFGVLIFAASLSAFFAPFAFASGIWLPLVGVILWALGMGTQESIVRAAVSSWIGPDKRATAYGILNMSVGVFGLLGGSLLGALYDWSPVYLMIVSVLIQLASIPFFIKVKHG